LPNDPLPLVYTAVYTNANVGFHAKHRKHSVHEDFSVFMRVIQISDKFSCRKMKISLCKQRQYPNFAPSSAIIISKVRL